MGVNSDRRGLNWGPCVVDCGVKSKMRLCRCLESFNQATFDISALPLSAQSIPSVNSISRFTSENFFS